MKGNYDIGISVIGAGILGFGLGTLLTNYFQDLSWIIIILGIILHGFGMYRVYKEQDKNLVGKIMYRICWIILIILLLIFIFRRFA